MASRAPYIVVASRDLLRVNEESLMGKVMSKIGEGYVPQGGVSADQNVFYQALVLPEIAQRGGTRRQRSRRR